MAEEKSKNTVTVKKVIKNYDKVLAAFGGMAAGKLLSHFLDKAITSAPVQGLVGVELSENMSKYVKPLVVTGVGLTAFAMSKNQHVKYAGIGCSAIGAGDLVNVITGKDYLAGINGAGGFGQPDNADDFQIIDLDTMQPIPPAPALDLPILTGSEGIGTDNEPYDEYEEPYEEKDFYVMDDELEAA